MSKIAHNSPPTFKSLLLASLAKLADPSTQQTAIEEVKAVMKSHITNADKMNAFIVTVTDFNDCTKLAHKAECIKLFGVAGEIFEETLVPFVPKILSVCIKKAEDGHLHQPISDSVGIMCHFIMKSQENTISQMEFLQQALEIVFRGLLQLKKLQQIGCGMMLTRIIQNCPTDCLLKSMDYISERLVDNLKNSGCKCLTQVFECIIFIVLEVGNKFNEHVEKFMTCTIECMNHPDWQVRKMSIDTIYTFTNFIPEKVLPFAKELLDLLKTVKIDKVKHVREAALEAIQKIRTIYSEQSTYLESPQKEDKNIFQKNKNNEFFKAAHGDVEIREAPKAAKAKQTKPINPNIPKKEINLGMLNVEKDDSVNIGVITQESKDNSISVPYANLNKTPEDYTRKPLSPSPVKPHEETRREDKILQDLRNSNLSNATYIEELKEEINKILEQQVKLMETVNSFQKINKDTMQNLTTRFDKMENTVQQIVLNRSIREERIVSPPYKDTNRKGIAFFKAVNFLQEGKINEAYSCILAQTDDMLLIRLMGRTRIVINELDQPNRDLLLDRIIEIIDGRDFIDFLLPWISSWVDPCSEVDVPLHQASMISDCMKALMIPKENSKKLSIDQIEEVKRILDATNK